MYKSNFEYIPYSDRGTLTEAGVQMFRDIQDKKKLNDVNMGAQGLLSPQVPEQQQQTKYGVPV